MDVFILLPKGFIGLFIRYWPPNSHQVFYLCSLMDTLLLQPCYFAVFVQSFAVVVFPESQPALIFSLQTLPCFSYFVSPFQQLTFLQSTSSLSFSLIPVTSSLIFVAILNNMLTAVSIFFYVT